MYLRQISSKGLQCWCDEVLAVLEEEAVGGELQSTSALDESVSLRRSAIPVEQRLSAAYKAKELFDSGMTEVPSGNCGMDWSCECAGT